MTEDVYDSKSNLWEIMSHLWSKYISLSQEYKMLKEKWIFLENTNSPALPLKANSPIFKAIDESIVRLDQLFNTFNFTKNKKDEYTEFFEANLNVYTKIKEDFFYLVSYVGLLKLAYFQRSVSLEMAHSTTGFPQSPEKTTGSELVYIAADNVAKAYSDCVKLPMRPPHYIAPSYQWDEFVSFVPPITASDFYGAFCKPSPYGLYHLSLSEEQKPSISSLLILAHEVGHVPAFDPNTDTGYRDKYLDFMGHVLQKSISTHTQLEEGGTICKWEKCRRCVWNPYNWLDTPKIFFDLFEQCFADVIGLEIGGPMTMEVFLNETYTSEEAIVRLESIHTYMQEGNFPETINLSFRIGDIIKRKKAFLCDVEGVNQQHPLVKLCLNCILVLGKIIGGAIYDYKHTHPNILFEFIERGKSFSISSTEEDEIIDSLARGIACPNFSVRKILHSYVRAFKITKELPQRPRYSVTLHSIAFNSS